MSVLNSLGIARKANRTLIGEPLVTAIRKNRVYLVIIAKDCGLSVRKKITDKCRSFNVPYVEYRSKRELGTAIGMELASAVGITDRGLAVHLLEAVNESESKEGDFDGEREN